MSKPTRSRRHGSRPTDATSDRAPAGDEVTTAAAPPSESGLARWLQEVQAESLPLSYWFEPTAEQAAGPVVIRFSGHRLGTGARSTAQDHFVQDETITGLVPGGGPVCVTARVTGVNAGEWQASAAVVEPARSGGPGGARRHRTPAAVHRAAWSWRSRSLAEAPEDAVHTCPAPFARVPGVIRGIWGVMLLLGFAVALTSLALVSRAVGDAGPVLVLTIAGLACGAVGAKLWYIVLHRTDGRMEGWCVQGLVAGVLLTVVLAALIAGVPAGVYLDAAAPGLLVGVGLGRIGCFFAGCCSGRPTAAWWGVWSSDRRLGMRRVPTQLMESALAIALGALALAVILGAGPAHGGIFLGSLAAYTLVRQAILHLRSESRRSVIGSPLTAAAAAAVVVADLVIHAAGVLRFPAGA